MSANGKDVAAQHDPTSLGAWQENNFVTVMFTETLGFKVRHIDILQWINEQKGNPILIAMQKGMNDGDAAMEELASDDHMKGMAEIIDKLLVEIVISPMLVEQGHEDGYSLRNVSLAHKIKVFEEMTGGVQFNQMAQFREVPASNVVNIPQGKNVPNAAE